MIELRRGRWQDTLADVRCDAVIGDPPYTKRTMVGFRSGKGYREDRRIVAAGGKRPSRAKDRPTIPYAAMDRAEAVELAAWATRAARHWIVLFNDHVGWSWLDEAIRAQGWYTFPPNIWHANNSPPRFQGDGPNNPFEYIVVARPRRVVNCGSLKAFYDLPRLSSGMREAQGLTGQKPLELMRQVIDRYTKPGQLICDPYAGTASTLIAAHQLDRPAIGSERDPDTHAKALDRIVQHVMGGQHVVQRNNQTAGRAARANGRNGQAQPDSDGSHKRA